MAKIRTVTDTADDLANSTFASQTKHLQLFLLVTACFLYFLISRYLHTWISFLYSGFNKITYDCRTDRRTREKINKRSSIEAVSCFLTVRDHKSIHPFCNAVMLPLLSEDKSPVHRNISTYSNKPITPKVNTESPVHLFSKCVKVQSLGTLGGS